MLKSNGNLHPLLLLRKLIVALLFIATTALFGWDSFQGLINTVQKDKIEKNMGFAEEDNEDPFEKQTDEKTDLLTLHKLISGYEQHSCKIFSVSKILNGHHAIHDITPVHFELISPPPDC